MTDLIAIGEQEGGNLSIHLADTEFRILFSKRTSFIAKNAAYGFTVLSTSGTEMIEHGNPHSYGSEKENQLRKYYKQNKDSIINHYKQTVQILSYAPGTHGVDVYTIPGTMIVPQFGIDRWYNLDKIIGLYTFSEQHPNRAIGQLFTTMNWTPCVNDEGRIVDALHSIIEDVNDMYLVAKANFRNDEPWKGEEKNKGHPYLFDGHLGWF